MKKSELEKKIRDYAERIEENAAVLNDPRWGIDADDMMMGVEELRDYLNRLESCLEKYEDAED